MNTTAMFPFPVGTRLRRLTTVNRTACAEGKRLVVRIVGTDPKGSVTGRPEYLLESENGSHIGERWSLCADDVRDLVKNKVWEVI